VVRSELEVADIFRRHGHAYRLAHDGHLGRVERRVMSAIELCRTAALGGHVEACEDCAHSRVAYNSCRNRHCPKCQSTTREQWLADRQADLLPVPYFHVVFTMPAEAAEIAFHNKVAVYAILFDAVAATLKTIAAERWLACRPRFFLPVHVLSRLFRRLFLERLQAAHLAGKLRFSGTLAGLDDAEAFAGLVRQLRRKDWIVFAKPPFGSPEHVLAYLGRYTHRVAIANSRLVSANNTDVTFRWRDYRRGNAPRLMSLDPHEFIRRFLIHCLPDGFHRIRHYGFLANGCRRARLAIIRQLLVATQPAPTAATGEMTRSLPRFDPTVCPCCGGILRITATLPHWRARPRPPPDTS
jgi:hypothetical protein